MIVATLFFVTCKKIIIPTTTYCCILDFLKLMKKSTKIVFHKKSVIVY